MGTITVEYSSNLYWLGRYVERVYTTLNTFFDYYDKTLDKDKNSYKEFLGRLDIEDKYGDYIKPNWRFPRRRPSMFFCSGYCRKATAGSG